MVNTRQCPECGKQYGSKARFCRHDGAQLIDLAPKSGPEPGRGRVNPGPGARGVVSLPGVAAQTQKGTAPLLDAEEEHGSFVGRVIAGRFLLEQFLGSGATGLVYRATHKVLNRPMAVKLLKREFIWDERSLLRFLREARTCSVMDHPNIVYLYDFGRDELGEPYLVIEYVDGRTLLSAIHSSPTRTLPVSRVLNIMLQLAHALAHAHSKGVVHRDIKPENIVLTRHQDQDDWVKVLDFGVARIIGQAPVTGHGQITGTAEFIAPETLIGDGEVAPPVDLYAAGIVFHDAIVGRPPFTGKMELVLHQHMHTVAPLLSERVGDGSIPLDLDILVARLLEKDPSHRPTASELVAELENICTQLGQSILTPARSEQQILNSLQTQPTQRLSVYQRPTSIVAQHERRTALIDRSGRPTQLIDRQSWPTRLLQNVSTSQTAPLERITTSESQERAYETDTDALFGRATALAAKLWPTGWPQALLNLRSHVADCDRAEQDLSGQLQTLEKHLRESVQVQQRHQELRQGILSLSDRLQTDATLGEDDRQRLFGELEDLERSFFATEQRWRAMPAAAPEPLRHRLAELRSDRQRARCLFVRLVVEMPCPAAHVAERDRVAEQLADVENGKRAWQR
jgi:serine/threonine protein kinase